jgi:hypothetical protein
MCVFCDHYLGMFSREIPYAALGQNAKTMEAIGIRTSMRRFPKTLPIWVDDFFKLL